jgi:hypothetical protein
MDCAGSLAGTHSCEFRWPETFCLANVLATVLGLPRGSPLFNRGRHVYGRRHPEADLTEPPRAQDRIGQALAHEQ